MTVWGFERSVWKVEVQELPIGPIVVNFWASSLEFYIR